MMARKSNRWIDTLKTVVDDYNAKPRLGTTFPRKDITEENYIKMLGELWKSPDPDSLISLKVYDDIPDEIGDVIFRFKVGDSVTLSSEAVIGGTPYVHEGNQKKTQPTSFKKKSVTGSWFLKRVFKIKRRMLRATSRFHMTPCYKISSSLGGYFIIHVYSQTMEKKLVFFLQVSCMKETFNRSS